MQQWNAKQKITKTELQREKHEPEPVKKGQLKA